MLSFMDSFLQKTHIFFDKENQYTPNSFSRYFGRYVL